MMADVGSITWPLLIAGVVYYFRDDIKAALRRLKELGLTGVKLDIPTTQQQPIATAPAAPTAKDLVSGIKQFISPEQIDPAVNKIKAELQAQTSNTAEQLEIMIHGVASLNIQLAHERTYRIIFGSQTSALVSMNNPGGASEETLKQIYTGATTQYPEFYKDFSFEKWIGFLINSGLAVRNGSLYETTAYGRGFLKYAVDMHLSFPKPL